MAAAGLIEKMGRERLKPREDGAQLPHFTFGALRPGGPYSKLHARCAFC